MMVLPNPTTPKMLVEVINPTDQPVYMSIDNDFGKTIYRAAAWRGTVRKRFNLAALPDGIYRVIIKTDNRTITIHHEQKVRLQQGTVQAVE